MFWYLYAITVTVGVATTPFGGIDVLPLSQAGGIHGSEGRSRDPNPMDQIVDIHVDQHDANMFVVVRQPRSIVVSYLRSASAFCDRSNSFKRHPSVVGVFDRIM